MPQRPRSHRLEDESCRAFAAAIDPAFTFYPRPQPEYGIDGDVEEFDDQGQATGLHFFVQLKGTDEQDLAKALAVSISQDTADYYRSVGLPVLMVRYHALSRTLFTRWFHQYDPYEGRGGAKTLTFRWQPEDAWKPAEATAVAADARAFLDLRAASLQLPRPIHLVTAGAFGLAAAELSLAVRATGRERSDIVELRGGPPEPGSALIEISDEQIRVDLAKVTGATLHFDHRRTDVTPEQLAIDAMALVALAFERVGQDDLASRLAATYFVRSSLAGELDTAFALAASMARAHRVAEALELSERLDDPDSEALEGTAVVFGFPALYKAMSLSDAELRQHEEVLKRRAKRRKKTHPVAAARAYVNLASFNRSRHRWDTAASYYELARKLDPDYASRAHYWFEYGSALWGTARYTKGAEAYRRARELGTSNPKAVALEADCLMFAGDYEAALELFETFNASNPDDDGEYRLKARAVGAIVRRLGIKRQERDTYDALSAASDPDRATDSEWAQMALGQLARDALWGSAWLNLGIIDHRLGQPCEGLDSFVASTVLIPADLETWEKAMFSAYSLGERGVLSDLVRVGTRLAGDALIGSVLAAADRPDSPVSRAQLSGVIDEILKAQPSAQPGFTVRMLREDGSVEEIPITDERA